MFKLLRYFEKRDFYLDKKHIPCTFWSKGHLVARVWCQSAVVFCVWCSRFIYRILNPFIPKRKIRRSRDANIFIRRMNLVLESTSGLSNGAKCTQWLGYPRREYEVYDLWTPKCLSDSAKKEAFSSNQNFHLFWLVPIWFFPSPLMNDLRPPLQKDISVETVKNMHGLWVSSLTNWRTPGCSALYSILFLYQIRTI